MLGLTSRVRSLLRSISNLAKGRVLEPSPLPKAGEINARRRIPAAGSVARPQLQRDFFVAERYVQRRVAARRICGSGVFMGFPTVGCR